MSDANALKEQGNEALSAGNISRAIECYSRAIQLTNNFSELAIFYSNRAQAFMDQRSFFEALNDISQSLNYDPDFKKTILRRAVVYFELGNYKEAARDFRFILRHQPDNPSAQIYMKRMFPSVKLNDRFLETYTIHGLRFAFKHPHNCIATEHAIKFSLIRHLFMSSRFSPVLGHLLKGMEMFDESPNQTIGIRLPVYFKNKWEHVAMLNDKFAVCVSDNLLYLILNMTQPTNTYLFLGTTTGIFRYGQFYNFDFISLSPNLLFYTNHINKEAIPLVETGGPTVYNITLLF
ncbi:Protein unc-45-like protein B [Aphelenchoides bicaudatus]|nr:Protein unc-45-like protein B [Aphelenchoides bicaudatus]